MLSTLGLALLDQFEWYRYLPALDEAIAALRQAVAAGAPDHPDRLAMLANLGTALQARFELSGHLPDVDEAITTIRDAIIATPLDNPDRSALLSNLGNALRTRFQQSEHLSDVDEAITIGREAVAAASTDHSHRPAMLSNLGNALQLRFERSEHLPDLDDAITIGREAVAIAPPDHLDRSLYLSCLGNALQTRSKHTGSHNDLDSAIANGREAVVTAPPNHPERPGYLSNLGIALQNRFGRSGQLADLDEAIMNFQEAVATTPLDHLIRPGYMLNLGVALEFRYGRSGQLTDLDESINIIREAVATASPDDPRRPMYLSTLGVALRTRVDRLGQAQDLNEAITTSRESVSTTAPDHPTRPGRLSNLGLALRTRFYLSRHLDDLNEAIVLVREAVATTTPDHPDRVLYLSNLGDALRAKFYQSRQQVDLHEAIAAATEGAAMVTASPGSRLRAARQWGQLAMLAGEFPTAVQAYTTAIEALPLVVWHGLDQATREHHLNEWAGLGADAAAAAIAAGNPVRAVELLEAGRAMLWTQTLHLRQDLSVLGKHEVGKGLVEVLDTSRAILDTPLTNSFTDTMIPDSSTPDSVRKNRIAEQRALAQRRQAAHDWDTTVRQIRELAGFENFLQPVRFPALSPSAAGGAVVIVNISVHGSHAMVITSDTGPALEPGFGVQVVDLPDASIDAIIDQVNALLEAQHRAEDPAVDSATTERDRHTVFDVLAWTWRTIADPVLNALNYTTTPTGPIQDWPRIWWCPTGPATALPLHAAGNHPRTRRQYEEFGEAAAVRESVLGRVIPSYTPTLAGLTRARSRHASAAVKVLAVGVPDAPGQPDLPAVVPELQSVATHLPPPRRGTYAIGPAATRDTILQVIGDYSWLHLSCHGVQHPDHATQSAFLLYDQPLTLADLAALTLPHADLAYLGACQTATGDLQLMDEALHLASGLQLVGYRHVLATLWKISDEVAPAMADAIYGYLMHPGSNDQPESDRAPQALHHAITKLRRTWPGHPLLWAPYVHLGP